MKVNCEHEWRLLKHCEGSDDNADLDWNYAFFYCIHCLKIARKELEDILEVLE